MKFFSRRRRNKKEEKHKELVERLRALAQLSVAEDKHTQALHIIEELEKEHSKNHYAEMVEAALGIQFKKRT